MDHCHKPYLLELCPISGRWRLLRESETGETPQVAKRTRRLTARPRKAPSGAVYLVNTGNEILSELLDCLFRKYSKILTKKALIKLTQINSFYYREKYITFLEFERRYKTVVKLWNNSSK